MSIAMTTLNAEHPIFDGLVQELGVDSRLTEFREKAPDGTDVLNKAEHDKWYARIDRHYTTMAERDLDVTNKEIAGGKNLRKNAPNRADRVQLFVLEAEQAAKVTKLPTKQIKPKEEGDKNE